MRLLTKDLSTRQHLLYILNILQSSESLALTSDLKDLKKTFLVQAKLSLNPLFAAILFMEARIALRRKALMKIDSHNPHAL